MKHKPFSWKVSKAIWWGLLAFSFVFLIGTSSFVLSLAKASSASPTLKEGSPSPTCSDLGYNYGYKFDSPIIEGKKIKIISGVGSITIDVADNKKEFDWQSSFGIDGVIVKGGDDANFYEYILSATSDNDLVSPKNKGGQVAEISHINFCWNEVSEPLYCELELTKVGDSEFVEPGNEMTYVLNLKNTGTADCTGTGVRVKDFFGEGMTYVSSDMTPEKQTNEYVKWNVGTLEPNEEVEIELIVQISEEAECDSMLENKAKYWSSETDWSDFTKEYTGVECPIDEPDYYTVTFDGNGGTPTSTSTTVEDGETVDPLPLVTRDGYDFVQWTTNQDGTGDEFTTSTTVTGDITVYAQWQIKTYTVTFDGNGGTPTSTEKTVEHGATTTLPTVTRDGYIFVEWNTESDGGGSVFNETTVVTANITVYAQWEPVEPEGEFITVVAHKIVCENEIYLPNWGAFIADGNPITSTTAQDFLTQANEKAEREVCRLEEGWEFEWANEGVINPGNNEKYGGESWNTFGPTGNDGQVIVYIESITGSYVWVREAMKEGYIPFSGTTENPHNDVSAELYCHIDVLNYDNYERIDGATDGETYYCVAFNAPKMCTVVSDTTNIIEDGTNAVEVGTWVHSAWANETSLGGFAKWIWETAKVLYPEIDETKTFIKMFSLDAVPLSASIEIAADNGFILEINGEVIVDKLEIEHNYGTIQSYPVENLVSGENTIRMTVRNFGQEGATPESNPAGALYKLTVLGSDDCEHIDPIDMCLNIDGHQSFVPEGYQRNDEGSCFLKEETTDYTVTFDGNGGTPTSTSTTVEDGETVDPLPLVTRDGYIFVQWNTNSDGSGDIFTTSTAVTANITVYAKWQEIAQPTYHLLTATTTGFGWATSSPEGINCGYGASDCSEEYLQGTEVTLTATPGGGQKFDGWSGDCSSTSTVCSLTMDGAKSVSAAFSLIPGVVPMEYTVTFDGNGGTPTSTEIIVEHGATTTLPTVTRDGYIFVDWNTNSDGSGNVFNETTVVTTDITVYAQWEPVEPGNFVLTASKTGSGTGTVTSAPAGINCGADCSESYVGGTSVTLTATPSSNNNFTGWSGCDSVASGKCVVEMNQNRTVTANFNRITSSGGGRGSFVVVGSFEPEPEPEGEVLGETIVEQPCGIYLFEHIKYGAENNPLEVTKLQAFLNEHMNAGLSLTGIYDLTTKNAVDAFQAKYTEYVMQPWVDAGIQCDDSPTSYVYKTTKRWINLIKCPSLYIPMPDFSQYEKAYCPTASEGEVLGEETIAGEEDISDTDLEVTEEEPSLAQETTDEPTEEPTEETDEPEESEEGTNKGFLVGIIILAILVLAWLLSVTLRKDKK